MKKFFCSLTVLFLISFLAGCEGSSKKPWKGIKAPELISQQQLPENKTMTVGLNIYLFRIQTDKLMELGEQISKTDTLPVTYNDFAAFSANGLVACAGDRTSWQQIAPLLSQSKPEIKKRINLLITENLPDDIIIAESSGPVSFLYHWGSATAGIGFDTGRMLLRIKVEPLIGLLQSCKLNVTPVYKIGAAQKTKKWLVDSNSSEFAFEAAALNACLQPGQFVLLAPARTKTDQSESQTLADLMFYSQNPQKITSIYLIACSLINSPP